MHLAGARVHRDDTRLREDDAASTNVDERVGGPKVDRHVAAAETGQIRKEAHGLEVAGSDGRSGECRRSLTELPAPSTVQCIEEPRDDEARETRSGAKNPGKSAGRADGRKPALGPIVRVPPPWPS